LVLIEQTAKIPALFSVVTFLPAVPDVSEKQSSLSYKDADVDIDAVTKLVKEIKSES